MIYRTFTKEQLDKILADHSDWLKDPSKGCRADLRSADLSYANLSYADLRSADLSYANLRYADLRSANLSYANLRSADLSYANLSYADLSYADLLIFQFQRHTAYFTFDGSLRIGCQVLPITEWAETYQQIGESEGYTAQQIKAYGGFIKVCLEMFKEMNP